MSYYEDDGGDDYMTAEQAEEMGWISEDVVEEIRELLKHIDYPDPFPEPGNRSHAALILIDNHINPPPASKVEDPNVTWAKHLMKDVIG